MSPEQPFRYCLGSQDSEDALTWNVFRSVQKARRLDIVSNELDIGKLRDMLLWTLASETDSVNKELQHGVGTVIREFDGIFRGQMTDPYHIGKKRYSGNRM
jgi:hypothetical protein